MAAWSHRRAGWLAAAAALVVVVVTAFPAWARTIVVDEFEGPKAVAVRQAVLESLGKGHEIVATARWQRAAKRLGVSTAEAEGVRAVAEETDVDVVLGGRVRPNGAAYELELSVREGKTGRVVATIRVPMRKNRPDEGFRRVLSRQLPRFLAKIQPVGGSSGSAKPGRDPEPEEDEVLEFEADEREPAAVAAATEPDAEPAPEEESDDDSVIDDLPVDTEEDEAEKLARDEAAEFEPEEPRSDRPGATRAGSDEEPAGDAESPAVTSRSPARSALAPWTLSARAGIAFSSRRWALNYAAGLDDTPGSLAGSPTTHARAEAAIYPTSLFGRLPLQLGFEGYYQQGIGGRVALADGAGVLATTEVGLGGSTILRYDLTRTTVRPRLELRAGYHRLRYGIRTGSSSVDIDIPDVTYTFIDPGVRLELAFGERIRLFVGGSYLHVLGAGQVTAMDQYGPARIVGFGANAGLEVRPFRRWVVGVGGSYTHFAYTFRGGGPKATMRDADPDLDVAGGIDAYTSGHVTIGAAF